MKSIKDWRWQWLGYSPVQYNGKTYWIRFDDFGYSYREILVNGKSCYGGRHHNVTLWRRKVLTMEECDQLAREAIKRYLAPNPEKALEDADEAITEWGRKQWQKN